MSTIKLQSREACEAYFKIPGNYDVFSKESGAEGMLNVFRSLGWNVSRIPLPEPPKPATVAPPLPPAYVQDFGVQAAAQTIQPTVAEPVRESVAPSPLARVSECVDEATFIDPLQEVPAAMKAVRQWVRGNLETRHGKQTKVPYQVNDNLASSDKPEQWANYQEAITGATIDQTKGAGFMFANGFAGIDLDGCRNLETGDITPWAENIIDKLEGAYVEISPSGTGLHIFVRATVPGTDRVFKLNPAIGYGKAAIEIYDTKRYFTVTGNPYFEDPGDIQQCDLTEVYEIFRKLKEENPAPRNDKAEACDASGIGGATKIELLGTFSTTKYDIFTTGEIESETPFVISNRLGRLTYPSQSEADLAFCTVLAFTHGDNSDAIWDEYTKSALVRDKWLDRREYFYSHTIAKAVASATRVKANETPTLLAPETPAVVAAPTAKMGATEKTERKAYRARMQRTSLCRVSAVKKATKASRESPVLKARRANAVRRVMLPLFPALKV